MSVVRGGKRLLNLRNNLEAADIDAPQWRDRWDAARWFIAADGDSQYQWGNGLICVDADTGEVSVTLPAALRRLANARPRPVRARPRCGVQPPRGGVGGAGRDRSGVLRTDLRSRQGVLASRRFVAARTNRGAEPGLWTLANARPVDLDPRSDTIRRRCAATTRPAVLERFAEDLRPDVRRAVAGNPATPTEVLECLAEDSHADVRRAVAENPATPTDEHSTGGCC